jgi:hypothetical protein
MKKLIIVFLIILLPVYPLWAQNFAAKKNRVVILPPRGSLVSGERLVYEIQWLGFPVGNIILSVAGLERINGREAYHIIGEAKPNRFFASLYDLRYRVDSYMDKDTYCTLRFKKTRIMQGRESQVEICFDQEKHTAFVTEKGDAPKMQVSRARGRLQMQNKPSTQTLKCSQDLFSTIYYLRLMELKEDSSYNVPIYYDKRNWITNIEVSKPWSQDFVRKGQFNVFKARIDSDLNEMILGMREITGTLTADGRRIPMEFRFGSGIGSFYGKIREISPSDG